MYLESICSVGQRLKRQINSSISSSVLLTKVTFQTFRRGHLLFWVFAFPWLFILLAGHIFSFTSVVGGRTVEDCLHLWQPVWAEYHSTKHHFQTVCSKTWLPVSVRKRLEECPEHFQHPAKAELLKGYICDSFTEAYFLPKSVVFSEISEPVKQSMFLSFR